MSEQLNTKEKEFRHHADKRTKWSLIYYLTGDPEQAGELAGYDRKRDYQDLIDWYQGLDLPSPISSGGADLLDSVIAKLPVEGLAGLIVDAAKDGKDNRMANQLIDLYLERERQEKLLKFSHLDVDQRLRHVLADEDFIRVVLTWIGREHIGRRLLTNPAYYTNIDMEAILLIQDIINKEIGKREGKASVV